MHERVLRQPVRGYYLAAYASPVGEFGLEYLGYYKVFGAPVDEYFDDEPCLLKGVADEVAPDPAAAVEQALRAAIRHVHNLRPAEEVLVLQPGYWMRERAEG